MQKAIRFGAMMAFLAIWAGGCSTLYKLASSYKPDECHMAKTSDDWTLALYRYRPERPLRGALPLILCHGLGMNSYLWDLDHQISFAKYLRDQGFEVWLADLRGAGRSSKPGWVILHDLMSGPDLDGGRYANASFRFDHSNWNMEDHILRDVPSILDKIKEISGAPRVRWIGHSMGGMIILAYLIRTQDPSIESVVAMATPMSMPRPRSEVLNILEQTSDLKQLVYLVNNRVAASAFGVLSYLGGTPMDTVLYNRANMDNETAALLLENAVEDLSPGVLEDFIRMVKTGEFISPDQSWNYTRSLDRVRASVLLVGGQADTMCSVASLEDTYRALASSDKMLRVFGRDNGSSVDYGHNDLVVGRQAPSEVYPYILDWLMKRS